MSKGIFIIPELPPYCSRCQFEVCSKNSYYCDLYESITVSLKPMPLTNRQEKPNWCPIKKMPDTKDIKTAENMTSLGWIEGWNACIDKIEEK